MSSPAPALSAKKQLQFLAHVRGTWQTRGIDLGNITTMDELCAAICAISGLSGRGAERLVREMLEDYELNIRRAA
jgi:hypothetical protein